MAFAYLRIKGRNIRLRRLVRAELLTNLPRRFFD